MPSDRGTMQRELPSGTQHQGIWPQATEPAARRLPRARRERKPALAALALLLIVGGALSAGLLVIQSGRRVAAIEIAQQLGAGQQIPLAAMRRVRVASGTGLAYVPWAEASQVARYYAATTIPPGTLLTSAMVAPAGGVTAGRDVLGLALKDGQWPDQLKAGDQVGIYAVTGQSGAGAGCPGRGGTALASDAVVIEVLPATGGTLAATPQGGTVDVTVAVNPAAVGAVACNAAAGNVAVAVLPPGGQPAGQPLSPTPRRGARRPALPIPPAPTGSR